MPRIASLAVFLVVVVGGGLLVGILTAPGEWYAALSKPPFNPPNWIFAPVWTVLYILIAIAGWKTWTRDHKAIAFKIWLAQLALNFMWSPIFFAAHQISIAALVIVLLLAAILAFIVISWRRERIAAWLFVPYAAWVAFASVLNISIMALN